MRLSSEKSSWTKRIVVFLRYMQEDEGRDSHMSVKAEKSRIIFHCLVFFVIVIEVQKLYLKRRGAVEPSIRI